LKHLAGLTKLTYVKLSGTRVTDAAMKAALPMVEVFRE